MESRLSSLSDTLIHLNKSFQNTRRNFVKRILDIILDSEEDILTGLIAGW